MRELSQAEPLRRAEILPLAIQSQQREQVYVAFASVIREGCLRLHRAHAESDPITGKQVSFGIVRMANIEPLIAVAKALYSVSAPENTRIHLCVYHSRFPLVQRSAIENLLDNTFNRRDDKGKAVYQQPEIRRLLDSTPEQQHIFIVLASPVCEVGRDWDADWALAEPSSMRSLIQLAGRVQRHRRKAPIEPNMLLLDAPINYFLRRDEGKPVYRQPGFEKGAPGGDFYLNSHWLHELLQANDYQVLSAIPRVLPRPESARNPKGNLVDLEHARMTISMLPRPVQAATSRRRTSLFRLEQDEAAPVWQYPRSMLTAALAQQQPFRDSAATRTDTLVFKPDDDEEQLLLHRVEDDPSARGQKLYALVDASKRHHLLLEPAQGISPWADFDLMALLETHAEVLDISLDSCAQKMATVEVLQSDQGWYWHPWLGFGKKH